MSDLKFSCPHCKQHLEGPEELLKRVVECPLCSKNFQVQKSELRQAPQAVRQNVNVEVKRGASPLGIAALVMGIIACLVCWVPFLGLLAVPLALIGIVLAFVGLIMALVSKKTGFSFPISGVAICLLSVFIAFTTTGGCAKAIFDATETGQRTNQTIVPVPGSQESPSVASPKIAGQPPKVPVTQWTKATSALRQGDIQIQVKSARVGSVALKDMFGDAKKSQDELLTLTIMISNLSAGKKIDFSTWRGQSFSFGQDFASLSDDNENVYKRINFGLSSVPVGGVDRESIYPGKSIADVLVFETPVAAAKWLHLELPAKNFDGEGMIRFEIPSTMITR